MRRELEYELEEEYEGEYEFEAEAELEGLLQRLDEAVFEALPGRRHPNRLTTRRMGTATGRVLRQAAPVARRVRFFTCSKAERTEVEKVVARPVPVETLRAAVEGTAGRAVSLTLRAAGALETLPRSAAARSFFCEAFGVTPEFVPPWRASLAGVVRWRDLGELVAIRLRNAATILDGGFIRYFCGGSPAHCPECTGDPSTYFACSSFLGQYIICLGAGFWRAWRDGDEATTASTLLHEALHIYFSRTVADVGRSGNANCYERFVVRLNGLSLHPATDANCLAGACSPAAAQRRILRLGSRGIDVQELQTRLNVWLLISPGVGVPVLAADGVFGSRTQAAVMAFQRANGLTVDGIGGSQTWGALPLL
jgi:hypothetical protein